MSKVLVTGGSGFLGSHCIVQLLQAGHDVRATVRSASRASAVRDMVRQGGADPDTRLDIAVADLGADAGWAEAAAGCDHVLHTASPFPPGTPNHEDELIVPAREGTLRVLRAARAAGVTRVVLTSSFAAIGYGHTQLDHALDESCWSRLEPGSTAYVKSKTLAERAAWDFVAAEGRGLELVVINPVGIFGPVLGPDYSSSIALIKRMLDGQVSACPQLHFGVVDVRDVAELHLRAMTHPQAAGQRFLASAGDCVSMLDVARMLRASLGETATLAPTRQLP
ncbi:aldehyde reductase, partial [Roseateles sp.]|uniref:SDR family oxidoreductase n=1 Tax=Roseateles sp. TaxID=1971397 RepID=UPI002F3FEEEA